VMRGMMIGMGAVLIARFYWTTYIFGALLLFTAARMLVVSHENLEPEKSPLIRMARRIYPVSVGMHNDHFFVREGGRWVMTPLLLVLLMVEGTDLLFAVDSIPAIFAVTSDPFLVYTSNVFAILGLRSLYFALAPLLAYFRFLKASLVFVLAFVGVKMLIAHHHPVHISVSLAVIVGILGVGILASVIVPDGDTTTLRSPMESEMARFFRISRAIAIRCVALVSGGALLAAGTILLVVPGLGVKAILLGLAILASQFVWAKNLLLKAEERFGRPPKTGSEPDGRSDG
jgi:tellurite resistance protein TerC